MTVNLPLRISRKEICHALQALGRGAFVTPQGRVRYDKLKTVFEETGLNRTVKRIGNVYSVQDTETIIKTLNLSESKI